MDVAKSALLAKAAVVSSKGGIIDGLHILVTVERSSGERERGQVWLG